ncbi:MAG TPA: site-2 protease family protein [Solirubrobacteraceae bacterium]|jgi:Zn-dependent protease|nr:site-2 protease family protein [Solirubrobacteraceae bacterium]
MARSRSIQLARIFGIRIGVNTSWFFVLFLFIYWLSTNFRSVISSDATAYGVAIAATLIFFACLILHELGHALMARREGIAVSEIELWLLGGFTRTSRDPDSPGAEFKIAAAGPLVTLMLSISFAVAAILVAGSSRYVDAAVLNRGATPGAALLLLSWLANINAVVFVLNLVPAFPLDGGRIFRAIAWKVSGDRNRGTRAAARLGLAFAYLAGALGVFVALSGDVFGGLWFIVIAFFLGQTARGAVVQSNVSERLEGVTVADIMDRDPVTVPDDAPLLQVEDEYFLRYRWPWFVVVDAGGRFLGIVRRERVEEEIAGGRPALAAREALEDEGPQWRIGPEASLEMLLASEGLRRLGGVAAVDADGVLRGVVTLSEVRRALTPATGL